MNIVKELNKHTIYYYCDNKIKYYINVPHKDFESTNISIEFLDNTSNFDPEISDIEWVKSNVIDYYEKVDLDNITLVLPILNNNEIQNLLTLDDNKIIIVEKLMSLYINSSYNILSKNKINVNKEVFLIENDKFNKFITFFKKKHDSRIIIKRLIEVNDSFSTEVNNQNKKDEIKPFSINENILNDMLITDNNPKQDDININKIPIIDDISNNVNNSNIEKNVNTVEEEIIKERKQDIDEKKENLNLDINPNVKSNNNVISTNYNDNNVNLKNKLNTDIDNNIDNTNLKVVSTPETKEKNVSINNNINKESDENKNLENKSNINKDNKEIKVSKISNPVEEKKQDPVNNVINISDLGSLTAGGLNGALPGNVTINIERLVTENKDTDKPSKDDEDADEVSELDEDISDIDEFDENEDFDLDAIDVSEAVLSNDDENKNYRTVTSGGIKFVVGRKDDENLKAIEINKNNNLDLNENKELKIDMPSNIIKGENQINKNAGFASYFTLFFVAISAMFIIVYIIIK